MSELQYEIIFYSRYITYGSNPIYLSLVSDDHEHWIDNKSHVFEST